MDKHDSEELTPHEKSIFKKLRQKKMPDSIVEKRIVNSLKEKGLLEHKKFPIANFSVGTKAALAVALGAVIFYLGLITGEYGSKNQPLSTSESQFALLIFNDNIIPDDELALAMEYGQWMQNIVASGTLASGKKLYDHGKTIRLINNEIKVTDVSPGQNHDQLGGFFLVNAEDYDEAVKIAASCPHLKYQGSIEVREIHKL